MSTSRARKAVQSASWMSLLALSLGVASSRTTSTEIRGEAPSGRGPMRLVVQEYEADAGGNLSRRARARSFAQRKITPAELRKGVQVELVDLSDKRTPGERVVVAWVERGEVVDTFDGRAAKPTPGSIVAKSKAGAGPVKLTLTLPPLPPKPSSEKPRRPLGRAASSSRLVASAPPMMSVLLIRPRGQGTIHGRRHVSGRIQGQEV